MLFLVKIQLRLSEEKLGTTMKNQEVVTNGKKREWKTQGQTQNQWGGHNKVRLQKIQWGSQICFGLREVSTDTLLMGKKIWDKETPLFQLIIQNALGKEHTRQNS